MKLQTIRILFTTLLVIVFIGMIAYFAKGDKPVQKERLSENNNNDTYANFSELTKVEKPGVDFDIDYREDVNTKTIVIAIHGGGIEAGTSELAKATASNQFSYYTFQGIKNKRNSILHITSTNFDEPRARKLVGKNLRTLSLHGYGDSSVKKTYIGGLDKRSKKIVKEELESAGFLVEDAPLEFDSYSPNNIANRNKQKKGVQLELSTALRKSFFANGDLSRKNRVHTTKEFKSYVSALQKAMKRFENQ